MMKSSVYRYICVLMAILLSVSCSIAPEMEERVELSPKERALQVPEGFTVTSLSEKGEIKVGWEAVENATHYEVEYESAVDYLSGKEMKKYITASNSFVLSSFGGGEDKRFVFRVRAMKKSDTGLIQSPFTEMAEGAVVDDYSVSLYFRDQKLFFSISYSNNVSIFNEGKEIVKAEVLIYEGDYSSSAIPEDALPIVSGEREVGSSETLVLTYVLMVEGKEIKRNVVSLLTDVDFVPKGITEISALSNEKDGIPISWTSPGINKGVEEVEILFALERKEKGEDQWTRIGNGEDKYFLPPSSTDLYAPFSISYFDTFVESGKEYQYRVVTYYRMDNNSLLQSEDNMHSDLAYMADEKVESVLFTLGEETIEEDGSLSLPVSLSWSVKHSLPSTSFFRVRRVFLDTSATSESSLDRVWDLNGDTFTLSDVIVLSSEEKKDPRTVMYYVSIVSEEEEGERVRALDKDGKDSIMTEGDAVVPIIKEGSLKATTDLNGMVIISWEMEESFPEDFQKEKVYFTVYRESENGYLSISQPISYSETSFVDRSAASGSYMVKPSYLQSDTSSPDYIYVRNYPFTPSVEGRTLSSPSSLSASYNAFNDKIDLTWPVVEGASSYTVRCSTATSTNFLELTIDRDKCNESDGFISYSIPSLVLEEHCSEEITIKVFSVDRKGVLSPKSVEAKGRILSPIVPRVENGSSSVRVTWDRVEGAKRYEVKVYPSSTTLEEVKKVTITDTNALEFILRSEDTEEFGIPSPLSSSYYFSVTPYVGNTAPAEEKRVEGHWILPPLSVTASKADYIDMTVIGWKNAGDADEYHIYYRKPGEEYSPDAFFTAPGTAESYNHLNSSSLYEYNLVAVSGGEEGPMAEREGDDNLGYPLLPPSSFSLEDLGESGFYKIVFRESLGATEYIINVGDGREKIIKVENIHSASKNIESISDGTILYDNGLVTLYMARSEVKDSLIVNISVKAKNSNGKLSYRNTTESVVSHLAVSTITDEEIVNLANKALNNIYSLADSYYGGDWWEGTSRKKFDTFGDGSAVFIRPSGLWTYGSGSGWENGTTTLRSYSYRTANGDSFSLSTVEGMELINKTENTYDLTTKLLEINGKVEIVLPYLFGVHTIEYKSFSVRKPLSGSVTVDGRAVDLSRLSVEVLP